MAPTPRLRTYSGPAILSYGFRPFFFLGALYAGVAIAIWLPIFFGDLRLPTAFNPLDWHIHEMLFGYLPAAMTGFLLTAIPNWTGRLPLQGGSLAVLVVVWLLGRIAIACSAPMGWLAALILDGSFLLLVAAAAAREITHGRNWRNLKVLLPLLVLALSNIGFHLEAHYGLPHLTIRVAISAIIVLIMVIGGRIVPSFTRNWLARQAPGRMPAAFSRFDVIAISGSIVALVAWTIWPANPISAVLLALAAIAQLARLARWAGERTWRDRLVLVLHIGYAFVPVGFALAAAGVLALVPESAGIHAFMAGAAGVMTLAVMSRATLGHSGRELVASRVTEFLYALVIAAAVLRVIAALEPAWTLGLYLAAIAWSAGFFGFAVSYGPLLWRPKRIGEND